MIRLAALALIVATPAVAQEAQPDGAKAPPAAASDGASALTQRVRSVVLYGEDECPAPVGDEVVVCARAGDSPYRIPKETRDEGPIPPANKAWATRVESIMEENKAGLPNSCSPIGTGGQTGCTQEMLQRWLAERRAQQEAQSAAP